MSRKQRAAEWAARMAEAEAAMTSARKASETEAPFGPGGILGTGGVGMRDTDAYRLQAGPEPGSFAEPNEYSKVD